MALSIAQTPASASLAQSPIIFSISESVTSVIANTAFQYVADLYYWTGSMTQSSSVSEYTMVKFPNVSLYGIFDLNRIINSTLTDLAQVNTSNVMYFACDFFTQYTSGSTFVTGSHLKSATYKALDGYQLFPEAIGEQIQNNDFWPFMTDGPTTQSVTLSDTGLAGIYVGQVGVSAPEIPASLVYTSNIGSASINLSSYTSSTSSSGQIYQYPIAPSEVGFPITGSGLTYYTITARGAVLPSVSNKKITYNVVCATKYPNVRVKFKNRFGQFDYFNFNMVSRQSFNTERRTYQPQLGTWGSSTLSYQPYNSSTLNYISDSKQAISVQTDWVSQDYNDIFKQLLVSDEIYWIYDAGYGYENLRPITISTDSITFKTGVVDKLIQYGFDFNFGQAYKLII
jgi:hypothetical protein